MNDLHKKPNYNKNNNTKTILVKSTTLTQESKIKDNCYTEIGNEKDKNIYSKRELNLNKIKRIENESSLNLSKNTSSFLPKNNEELDSIKNLVKLTVNGVNEVLKKTDQSLSKEKFSNTLGKFNGKKENIDTSITKNVKTGKSKETSIKKNNISLSKAITETKELKKSFNNNSSNKNFVKCYTYRKEIELDIDKNNISRDLKLKKIKNNSKDRQYSNKQRGNIKDDLEATINSNNSQSKKKSNFGYNPQSTNSNINFLNNVISKEKQYLAELVEIKELVNDSQEFMKVDSDENLLEALKSGNRESKQNDHPNDIQTSIECVNLSSTNKFTHDNKNDKSENDILKQISSLETKNKKRISSQVVSSLLNSSQGHKKGTSIMKNNTSYSNNTSNIVKSKLNDRKKENVEISKKSSSDLFLNVSVNPSIKNANEKIENILSKTSNNSFLNKHKQDNSHSKKKISNNSKIKCPTEVPKVVSSKFKSSDVSNELIVNRKIMDKFSSKEKDKIQRKSNEKFITQNTYEKHNESYRKIKDTNKFTPPKQNLQNVHNMHNINSMNNQFNIKTVKNSSTPISLIKNSNIDSKNSAREEKKRNYNDIDNDELIDSTEDILSKLELTAKKTVVNNNDNVKIIDSSKLIQLKEIIEKFSYLDNEISNSLPNNVNKTDNFNFDFVSEKECNLDTVLNKLYINDKEEAKEDNNSPKFIDLDKMSKLKKKSLSNQVNDMISYLNKTVDIYNKLSKEINN